MRLIVDAVIAGPEHGRALGRQVGEPERRLRLRLRGVRVGREERVRHPPDRVLAAVAGRDRRGIDTAGLAARAVQADVEVVVMAPPRADLAQPVGIAAGRGLAERELDRGGDEDALDARVAGGRLEERGVRRRPVGVDVALVVARTIVAPSLSRSERVRSRRGGGVYQMSTSRPDWWLAWPLTGPPRAWPMSPT